MKLQKLFHRLWFITYKLPNQSGGLIASGKTASEAISKMFDLLAKQ
jgi:hypothetical protein